MISYLLVVIGGPIFRCFANWVKPAWKGRHTRSLLEGYTHEHRGQERHHRCQPGPGQHAEGHAEAHRPTSRADPRMRLVQVIDFWPGSGSGAAWCSFPCRHRAWELTRAAASGLAAVQVIDRVIQVDGPFTVNERVEVEFVLHRPAWLHALAQLTEQIGTGRTMTGTYPPSPQPSATFVRPEPPAPSDTVNTLRKPPVGARLDDRRRHAAAEVHRALDESAASGFEISDHCADLCRRVDGLCGVQRGPECPLPGLPLGHLFW